MKNIQHKSDRKCRSCALLAVALATHALSAQTQPTVELPSTYIRAHALESALPAYPQESLDTGREGRVVVRIVIGIDGAVESTQIMEATDESMGASVKAALQRWRFRSFRDFGESLAGKRISGRLIFYFTTDSDEAPRVTDAVAVVLAKDKASYETAQRQR